MLFGGLRRERMFLSMIGNLNRRQARLRGQIADLEARIETLEGMAHIHVPGGMLSLRRAGAEDCKDGGWWLRLGEETYADQDG